MRMPSGGIVLLWRVPGSSPPIIPRDIEKIAALAALAALAQESRLVIYRLLVQAGADGLPAGQIGEQLGFPSATLAFHLKELKNAGLATYTRNGCRRLSHHECTARLPDRELLPGKSRCVRSRARGTI
jgi:predicted transcriptional regulator